jgi:hypothetical protein
MGGAVRISYCALGYGNRNDEDGLVEGDGATGAGKSG